VFGCYRHGASVSAGKATAEACWSRTKGVARWPLGEHGARWTRRRPQRRERLTRWQHRRRQRLHVHNTPLQRQHKPCRLHTLTQDVPAASRVRAASLECRPSPGSRAWTAASWAACSPSRLLTARCVSCARMLTPLDGPGRPFTPVPPRIRHRGAEYTRGGDEVSHEDEAAGGRKATSPCRRRAEVAAFLE
jgi:hypothetical protein